MCIRDRYITKSHKPMKVLKNKYFQNIPDDQVQTKDEYENFLEEDEEDEDEDEDVGPSGESRRDDDDDDVPMSKFGKTNDSLEKQPIPSSKNIKVPIQHCLTNARMGHLT
eukprot:TRINITY_DN1884_c0_g1_i3.p3 TRINITY_DN1884_c0_g1~~TRINITY_DN1884_c0_g1_i3.p3  ORF type:complete len:110 (-),score=29.39 TRINITY_DN1884_c0_g1_i3:280-609(-)